MRPVQKLRVFWNRGRTRRSLSSRVGASSTESGSPEASRNGSAPPASVAATTSSAPATTIGEWWQANREEIVNSTREIFETVEKALDGIPIAGPKAAFSAVAGVMRAIQTRWSNVDSLRDLAKHMDHLRVSLEDSDKAGVNSPELRERIATLRNELEERRKEWENQNQKSSERKLRDAAHIEQCLIDLEQRVSRAIDLFLFDSQLHIETVVDEIHRTSRRIEILQLARDERDLLRKLRPVAAYHDAVGGPDGCLEGTRESLLAHILDWYRSDARPIFWLNGLAGTGKSALARTVADLAEEQGQLGATFFFTRANAARRKPWAVIPTLAHQLAKGRPELCASICNAVAADSDVAHRNIDKQATALLGAAFAAVTAPLPRTLIVLDALDDCEKEGREALITQLLHNIRTAPFSVKIFITSRPEESLKAIFAREEIVSAVLPFVLHQDVKDAEIEGDIMHYLERGFEKVSRMHTGGSSDGTWPTFEQLAEIVRRSGQLFIYAATIMRYVSDPDSLDSPRTRLTDLLEQPASHAQVQYQMVDQLYIQLLDGACEVQATDGNQVCAQISTVAATLALLAEPLSSAAMSELLGLPQDRARGVLSRLSALTFVDSASFVRLYHPSFQDFILNPDRCTDKRFHVDEARHHSLLAQRCLHILNTQLKRDICGLRDPNVSSVSEGMEGRLQEHISEALRYSTTYWVHHFTMAAKCSLNPELLQELSAFCESHLIHWFELVSLLSRLNVAEDGLPRLLQLCQAGEHQQSLNDIEPLLDKAHKLLKAYSLPIRAYALHVYYSALVTISPGPLEVYAKCVPGLPRLVSMRYPNWETENLPDGHQKWIECLAFSPDGSRVISGSHDCTARIWNAIDGSELWCLQGHEKKITAVTFSADGSRAITASYDTTLRVWDVQTGRSLATLQGHNESITSLAVSAHGTRVASASYDGTVRVWGLIDSKLLVTLEGHHARVTSVTFSQDGDRIVSGDHDGHIRVWDSRAGTQSMKLEGHKNEVRSVALSPEGRLLASGSNDCSVRVWDMGTGQQLTVLEEKYRHACVVSVTFSPDGRWLIARYDNDREHSWMTDSIIDRTFEANTLPLDDTKPAEGPAANTFEWNYVSGWISWKPSLQSPTTQLCWLPAEPIGHRRGAAFAASSTRVAIGAPNGTVTILDFSEMLSLMVSIRPTAASPSVRCAP